MFQHSKRHSGRILILAAGMLALAACAGPLAAPQELGRTRETRIGNVLVGPQGMTLYTYASDEPGISNCTGLCAFAWPPLRAAPDADASDGFELVTRPDGTKQWAYEGWPLYLYIGDSRPGDVSGHGKDAVWFAARPEGAD